ncbi:MAG: HEAT repeat domain-containing protein [Planctomycetia bacterium]|nr:HEAT repeat domain-containing protein [Planctomycetia bacterium]
MQTQLDHADPDKRAEAAKALAKMGSNASPAVADLITALDDVFPKVQSAAIEALAAIGGDANPAIRRLYELVLKTTDDYQRGELVMAITSINPKCNELRLIVEKAIEGVSNTDINSMDEKLLANRLWACKHIATLGPEGNWAEPILRRLLRVTGQRLDLRKNVDVFQACTDALIAINANHGLTISLLEAMSRGRELRPSPPEAMQAADTALRKLQQ